MIRRLLAFLALVVSVTPSWSASLPRVYVVLVDGLGARSFSAELTPALWDLTHGHEERATFYSNARAVMPAVTNTNHVSIMTGVYAVAHGIVGNHYWERQGPPAGKPLDRSELVEVDTLFTAFARARSEATSAGVFGKWKLADLFGASEGQHAPNHLWADLEADRDVVAAGAALDSDQRTMNEALRTIAALDPALLFVALGDVDRREHAYGPDSQEARKAILQADREIERLVTFVKAKGIWEKTVMIVTSDHGFAKVAPDGKRPYPTIFFGRELARTGITGVAAVSNGGVESLYLFGAPAATEAAERLKRVRALALTEPEIAEALYRVPNVADGGREHVLAKVHPDWRFAHERAGDLILVAKPGYLFNDPMSPSVGAMRGSHGGPDTLDVPIVVSGGWERIRSAVVDEAHGAVNADIGMTVRWLLDLPEPRFRSGAPVPAELRGRVLEEAFEH
ncbi:MAG: hypothetical protein QOD06_2494 [Candidatus Binatota bacterium]|jgi:hypothetical protein|nr:hypothetical protein [Candidatus Binatota bacterium]